MKSFPSNDVNAQTQKVCGIEKRTTKLVSEEGEKVNRVHDEEGEKVDGVHDVNCQISGQRNNPEMGMMGANTNCKDIKLKAKGDIHYSADTECIHVKPNDNNGIEYRSLATIDVHSIPKNRPSQPEDCPITMCALDGLQFSQGVQNDDIYNPVWSVKLTSSFSASDVINVSDVDTDKHIQSTNSCSLAELDIYLCSQEVGIENKSYCVDDDDNDCNRINVCGIKTSHRRNSDLGIYSTKDHIGRNSLSVSNGSSTSKCSKRFSQCVVIFGAFWICFFSLGIPFSLATFLPVWLEEFGDGRAKTALIQSVLVGVLFGVGTIVGIVIDKLGIRTTINIGSVISCIGFIGAIFSPNTTVLVLTIGVISGVGLCCVYLGSVVAVSAICSKSASIAIGIIIAGGGLGQSVLPYFNDYLTDMYGWRGAFYIIAGLSLQPLVFGNLMTSCINQEKNSHDSLPVQQNATNKLKRVCCPRFIFTCIATCAGFASTNGFFFIILDFAATRHGDGVFYIFLITTVSTLCNIGFGVINMIPCVSSSFLLSLSVVVSGITLVLLSTVTDYLYTIIIIVVFGITYGGKIGITGVVILDLVGRDAYSLAMGITITVNGIASSLGGAIYGLLYDITRSYNTPLVAMGVLTCIAGTFPILGLLVEHNCRNKNLDKDIQPNT